MATYFSEVQKFMHFKFSWLILYLKKGQNDLFDCQVKRKLCSA